MYFWIVILVFLLKSFSASEVNVVPSDKLQLPNSSSRVKPEVAVTVMVRKDQILVDNEPLEFQLVTYEDPLRPGQVLVAVPDDQKESAAINDLYNRLNEFAKADEEIEMPAPAQEMPAGPAPDFAFFVRNPADKFSIL